MSTNPFAFPGQAFGSDGMPANEATPGMTLRDWFAGIADDQAIDPYRTFSPDFQNRTNTDVQARYAYADAMLAERERGQ